MKLNAVRLFVGDIAEAKDFYTHVLGLPLKADGSAQGYCILETGAVQLILEAVPADAPADDKAFVGRFTGLSFAVDDIQQKYRELQALGVEFSGEPELQVWGGWLATLLDPSGNGLQLVQLSS